LKAHHTVWHNQAIPYEADFSLNGNLNELERLAAEVSRFCRENALDDDAEFQLNLVLEELFVNTAAEPAKIDGPLEERQAGGLGIHLVRQIMRELHYERAGEWNQMSMKRPMS
jgi:serine/threonine-protein kinase RsbW